MSTPIRVLVADDHPVFRRGLRALLEETADITVIGDAADGHAALALAREQQPDVMVLDLDMPGVDGIAVAKTMRDEELPVRAVLLTAHKSAALVNRALDAGVGGYVLKDGAAAELVDCVRAVHAGQPYVSAQLSGVLLGRRDQAAAFAGAHPGLAALTSSERRVLTMIARADTSNDIAAALFISVRTVEHHRANIGRKLALSGSNALVKFAMAHRSELSQDAL